MFQLIKIELIKSINENRNNLFRLLIAMAGNLAIIVFLYYTLFNNNGVIGGETKYIIAYYSILWLLLSALTYTNNVIVNESKIGTIEQLLVSPFGIIQILISKIAIQILKTTLILALIISLVNLYFLGKIDFDVASFIIVVSIGMLSIFGVGIILASFSLISKEVNALTAFLRLLLLFLLYKFDNNIFIPFSFTKSIIIDILVNKGGLAYYHYKYILSFAVNSLSYFIVGLIVFAVFERISVRTGKILGY
ncbi:MAG TPA: hypothetical protein VEF53_21160 [Patescibacteria group bacterium]|nr:hypothetical protein [Patescibacteria group bacterium]